MARTTAEKRSQRKAGKEILARGAEGDIEPEGGGAAGNGTVKHPWENWEVLEIDPRKIVERGHTHRTESARSPAEKVKISQLADSIKRDGLLQPIGVYRDELGNFARIFGSRRTAAAVEAGLPKIRARLYPGIPSDAELHRLRAIENIQRRELNPAERAVTAKELFDAHMLTAACRGERKLANEAAARDLGERPSWIDDCVRIIERLGKVPILLLAEGLLNLGQARALAKLGPSPEQVDLAETIADAAKGGENWKGEQEGGKIWSVQEVENSVATKKRSLRVVPWKLDVAMKTGVAGCEACMGCQFNTATDTTLWGTSTSKEETEGGGCCSNTDGFLAKQKLAAKAQEKTVETISKQIKEKKIEKADAGGIDLVREAAPEYLKESSTQRYVRKDLGLGAAPEKKKAGGDDDEKKSKRDPWSGALLKWGEAWRELCEAVLKAIVAKTKKDPATKAAAILLSCCHLTCYDYPSGEYDLNKPWPKDGRLPPEKPLTPLEAQLLAAVEARDLLVLAENAGFEMDRWDSAFGIGARDVGAGPELLVRIVRAFGVEVKAKVPILADYLPAALKEKAVPAPAIVLSPAKALTAILAPNAAAAVKAGKDEKTKAGGSAGLAGTFAPGRIVVLKMGGDLGVAIELDGKNLKVKWAEDGDVSGVPTMKLRLANASEIQTFKDQAPWYAAAPWYGGGPAMQPKGLNPGTCRVCGCTMDHACEGGCSWANQLETICSRCVVITPIHPVNQGCMSAVHLGLGEFDFIDSCSHAAIQDGRLVKVLWIGNAAFACVARSIPPKYHVLMQLAPHELASHIGKLKVRRADTLTDAEIARGDFGGVEVVAPNGCAFVLTDYRIEVTVPESVVAHEKAELEAENAVPPKSRK